MHGTGNGACCRHGLVGGALQGDIVVFGDDKAGHQIAPSALSLSSSSLTFATLMPPPRLEGSDTFSTLKRGVMSTPSSAAVFSAMGFFLAFMMLGKEA